MAGVRRPGAGLNGGAGKAPLPAWARVGADGRSVVLTLHIQPGASVSGPAGRHGDAFKLRISAPAADNKANEALIDFLRRALGVSRAAVRIAQGAHARRKLVEIEVGADTVAAHLRAWDAG